jgi:hypothetical protein
MTQPEVCAPLYIYFDMMVSSFSSNFSDLKNTADPVLQEDSSRKWGLQYSAGLPYEEALL